MYRIWLERSLPQAYYSLLEGQAIIVGTAEDFSQDNLLQAEAIIAGGRLDYNADLMDRAPELRVIARTGIGYDKVAVPEATMRGIVVCNTPNAPTVSTAEHAIALMLAVGKQLKWGEKAIRNGSRLDFFSDYDGIEFSGATLGLIGLGRIGGRVAHIARGLGMYVIAYDPYVPEERAIGLEVQLVTSLEEVLAKSEVLSLHLPLTPKTQGMLNAQRIAQMKPGSILINTARGGLVDERALLNALENGHIYGAGLDVLQAKPVPSDHPLLLRDDVIISPHVASATRAGKDRLWKTAIHQALQVLQGKRPNHLLNPEVWDHRKV